MFHNVRGRTSWCSERRKAHAPSIQGARGDRWCSWLDSAAISACRAWLPTPIFIGATRFEPVARKQAHVLHARVARWNVRVLRKCMIARFLQLQGKRHTHLVERDYAAHNKASERVAGGPPRSVERSAASLARSRDVRSSRTRL